MINLDTFSGNPRFIRKFSKFIESINEHMNVYIPRIMKSEVASSPSIKFIKSILVTAVDNPNYLTRDIIDVYVDDIMNVSLSVSGMFDSTKSGVTTKHNIFVKGSKEEFMFPSSGIIGSVVSPFDGWDKWEDVQPICMVNAYTNELIVSHTTTQLDYKKDKPSTVVFAIDTAALIMKYIVYLREHDFNLTHDKMDEFIVKHVISFIYTDAVDVWVSRLLLGIVDNEIVEDYAIDSLLSKSEYNSAVSTARELITNYSTGKISLGDVLSTLWYFDKSFIDIANKYNKQYYQYPNNRYIGAELMKMSALTSILIELLLLTVHRKKHTNIIQKLLVEINILGRKKWESHISDTSVLYYIHMMLLRAQELKISGKSSG